MSTTGNVINCVFNTIAELGDPCVGSPFIDIVDIVKANILQRKILPQPRNIESHTRRAIRYGLEAGILAEPKKDCFKLATTDDEVVKSATKSDPDVIEDDDAMDDEMPDSESISDDESLSDQEQNGDEYSENDERLGAHRFYDDDDDKSADVPKTVDADDDQYSDTSGSSSERSLDEQDYDQSDQSGQSDNEDEVGEGIEDDYEDEQRNGKRQSRSNSCRGNKCSSKDENRCQKDRSSKDDRCGSPSMNCEPSQPCCPKSPNEPCQPRCPKRPCAPQQPCGPWSPYAPKRPKRPKQPECPKKPQAPTRCACRPRKCKARCRRDEPEHFRSYKDEHFDENESDDFDNSIKSYEVDDFKGDFKENNQNQSELEQIGSIASGSKCAPACRGSRCDSTLQDDNSQNRPHSDNTSDNDDETESAKKRHQICPNDKMNTASMSITQQFDDSMKAINRVQTTPGYVNGENDSVTCSIEPLIITEIDSSFDVPPPPSIAYNNPLQ